MLATIPTFIILVSLCDIWVNFKWESEQEFALYLAIQLDFKFCFISVKASETAESRDRICFQAPVTLRDIDTPNRVSNEAEKLKQYRFLSA